MSASGKTIGLILMLAGVVIFVVAAVFIGSGLASHQVQASGAILGIVLFGVLPLLLLGGVGAYLYVQGRAEARELAQVRRKERLLGMIQAQGKVPLGQAMIEMKMSRDDITTAMYELVTQGLFAGYIDWNAQTFYSQDAARVGAGRIGCRTDRAPCRRGRRHVLRHRGRVLHRGQRTDHRTPARQAVR